MLTEWKLRQIYVTSRQKSLNSHISQSVKTSKELVEGSDQILGRQVHGQQSETLDVCKKDAARSRERERVVKEVAL